MFNFLKIKETVIHTFPCGCLYKDFGNSLEGWASKTGQDYYFLENHAHTNITKGKKRWKKTVCNVTGKWWIEHKPDLVEVKLG